MTSVPTAAADEPRRWDLELGASVVYTPYYEGASAASPRQRIWADGAYRTESFGTFALDSGSLSIAPEVRWDPVDAPDLGFGLLVGYRTGRNDNDPGFVSAKDGSARLRGLPNVSDAVDAGGAGHVAVLGVPVFAQVRSALGRSQGTLVIVGAYLPLEVAPDLELTILPTVTWANTRQMRAFFGVSPTAAQASGFATYEPGGGLQSASIEIGANWHIAGAWHFIASIAYQRLLGGAARSPVVQSVNQPSILAGIALKL